MENLYYSLSEEEFSKGRKILLWSFATLFFLAGLYVLFVSLVLGQKSIPAILSIAPFGISLIVFIIAATATHSPTAPTVARASASSNRCLMTARIPR